MLKAGAGYALACSPFIAGGVILVLNGHPFFAVFLLLCGSGISLRTTK